MAQDHGHNLTISIVCVCHLPFFCFNKLCSCITSTSSKHHNGTALSPLNSHFFFFPNGAVAVKLGLTERLEAEPGDFGSRKTLHLQVAWVNIVRKNT